MRETRVDQQNTEPDGLLRCDPCDVAWWGNSATSCWFCGSPGTFASATRRVIRDESAA